MTNVRYPARTVALPWLKTLNNSATHSTATEFETIDSCVEKEMR